MSTRITKRVVDAASPDPARDVWIWDSEIRGFGLRVRAKGRKTYVVEYRPGAGGRAAQKRRYTIGAHGSPWTPDTARAEAWRVLGLVAQGRDPSAERCAARGGDGDTVADLAAAFIEKYARSRQKSWRETERVFLRDVNPAIGRKRVNEVSRQDVVRLLDQIAERGPVMADRTLAYVRKFYNWCIERDHATENPCAGLKPYGTNVSRDRVLSDSELAEVWHAAHTSNTIWAPFVKLLIITAQRRAEVAEMCWSEVDLEARTWVLPAERTKNKRAHEVPLTDTAIAILAAIPPLSYKDGGGLTIESPFVFTTTGATPFSGFSKAKKTLEQRIIKIQKARDDDAEAMSSWTFHDLRRTATTGMARLGVHPHIADAILNHKDGSIRGVAAVYNRHAYLDERRRALEMWEEHLLKILPAHDPGGSS